MRSETEINNLLISAKNNIKELESKRYYADAYIKSVIRKTLEWVLKNEN